MINTISAVFGVVWLIPVATSCSAVFVATAVAGVAGIASVKAAKKKTKQEQKS